MAGVVQALRLLWCTRCACCGVWRVACTLSACSPRHRQVKQAAGRPAGAVPGAAPGSSGCWKAGGCLAGQVATARAQS